MDKCKFPSRESIAARLCRQIKSSWRAGLRRWGKWWLCIGERRDPWAVGNASLGSSLGMEI